MRRGWRAVDLFAGLGGFTTGAAAAGVRVVWAANHWKIAVDTHQANHPGVVHACQDLRQADWSKLPSFDVLLASPACQGHSKASRGKRGPQHDAIRATAFAVLDCADVTEPKAIVIENVLDFLDWRLYPAWRWGLQCLGYELEEYRLRASHFGVPQRRDRLFIVGFKRPRVGRLELPNVSDILPEPAFGPCIDWSAPGWRPVTQAKPDARRRLEAARARFGRRALVQHVTDHRGISLDEPIRTITAKDQWVILNGLYYRPLTMRELARGMGFAESYTWDEDLARWVVVRMLGNAVSPPVAEHLLRQVIQAA